MSGGDGGAKRRPPGCMTLWDVAGPARMADVLRRQYGAGAEHTVMLAAVAALADGRPEDARFWDAARAALGPPGKPRSRGCIDSR